MKWNEDRTATVEANEIPELLTALAIVATPNTRNDELREWADANYEIIRKGFGL